MAVSSKQFVRARISRAKFRQLLKLFALDMAKTRLVKFRGVRRSTFYLHLKECEFRFNHRAEDLYQLLLKITRSAITI
jgi:transposase-like protein